jgi:hypothetical protein
MLKLKYLLLGLVFATLSACGGGDVEEAPVSAPPSEFVGPVSPTPPVVVPVDPAPVRPTPTPVVTPPVVVPEPVPVVTPPPVIPANTKCLPGVGSDYVVGAGQPYGSADLVPWESLKAGDSVRFTYSSSPYKAKFIVTGFGTSAAPITICGIPGPNGERPIIEGAGAVTRANLNTTYGNSEETFVARSERSIIEITKPSYGTWDSFPSYVLIKGLNIRNFNKGDTFTDARGASRVAAQFSACVWVDRGQNLEFSDNEVSNCSMAMFTKSTNDGTFAITTNLKIAGNYMWGHGVVGSDREHTIYTSGSNILYEFNHFGPLKSDALGNAIKDRSAGLMVRYNYIEEGAHSIDMVEAEDWPDIATKLTSYRSTYVYGNVMKKTGDSGPFFHYGGDHFGAPAGANWGETLFRRGTLYFWNNTVIATGVEARLFKLSTTLETAQIWNNVFYGTVPIGAFFLRQNESDNVSASYTRAGNLVFGVNWVRADYADSDIYHPIPGTISGMSNFITGSLSPIELSTYRPVAGSTVIDKAQANLSGVSGISVNYQFVGGQPQSRTMIGAGVDLGAIEY